MTSFNVFSVLVYMGSSFIDCAEFVSAQQYRQLFDMVQLCLQTVIHNNDCYDT
jgi:hypothetical protein